MWWWMAKSIWLQGRRVHAKDRLFAIVINVKADTKDIHLLCTDLCEFSL